MADTSGFSLIEIAIAMVLLALMTVGLLPLFFTAVRASAANRSLVEANTFANAQLSVLRGQFGNDRTDTTCSDLIAAVAGLSAGGDPSGNLRSALGGPRTETEGELPPLACTAEVPGPITVVVEVEVYPNDDRNRVITALSTEILVGAP